MVSLRKAGAYSKKHARPNTRTSKKKSKAYIKTVPPSKIVKFNIGNQSKYTKGEFDKVIRIISNEKVQIRDSALEASRQFITRRLDEELPNSYYFEVRVYPHHILRENKMLTGAGADRMSSGMKHSFGRMVGRAAIVNPGKDIFLIATSGEKGVNVARAALKAVKAKLPGSNSITVEKVQV